MSTKKTLGDIVDEFVERIVRGEKPKLTFKKDLLRRMVTILKDRGIGISIETLRLIKNPKHREQLETILISTAAFSLAGATIAGAVSGPQSAPVGAGIGAVAGFIAGLFVIFVSVHSSPDGTFTFEPT